MSLFVPTFDLVALVPRPNKEGRIAIIAEHDKTAWGLVVAVGPGFTTALPFAEGDEVLYNVKNCENVTLPTSLVFADYEDRPSLTEVIFVRAPNIYLKLRSEQAPKIVARELPEPPK